MGRFNEKLKAEAASLGETSTEFEMAGEKITLTARPLTPKDMMMVTRDHPNFQSSPNMEGMVDLLIHKARYDDAPAFDKADKPFLMRLPVDKIGAAFAGLFGSQLEADGEDEVEKKKGN